MQTNGSATENGKNYVCRSDGSLVLLSKAGWNFAEENWYYVQSGNLLQNCISKIASSYYAFDKDGKMQKSTLFSFTENDQDIFCFAQDDGSLLTNTSTNYGSATYYFDSEGKSRSGIQTISGKQYYLVNGQKQKNGAFEIDGSYYLADSDGQLKQVSGNNRWHRLGSSWYYIQDQHFLKNTVQKIREEYYGFSKNGSMYTNTFFVLVKNDLGITNDYYAQSDGTLLRNQWKYTTDGKKFFYGEDGKIVITPSGSVTQIDGKLYYLYYSGPATDTAVYDKNTNTNYAADGEGVLQE